jgi:hypothetical protein
LHLLELVEQRVEEDNVQSGRGDVAQTSDAVIGCAGDRDGGEVTQPEVAVPAIEGVGDPIAGVFGVVVDGDVDTLGNRKLSGSRC